MRCALFFVALLLPLGVQAQPSTPLLTLPTENTALLTGRPEDYYMYVHRNFQGQKSSPWQGGQYGMVRGPQMQGGNVIFTSLHEGIDIKPVRRDARGEPLDPILAAAAGKVVHVSDSPSGSNYGRYLVIEHSFGGSPFYTLYAHLMSISVKPGQIVRQGETIGRMGYTGAGIDKPRAHLHFEFCLLLNSKFEGWHQTYYGNSPNRHGIYNGRNLVGINPAQLLIESYKNPNLDIREFILRQPAQFSITLNNTSGFELIRRYPWMVPAGSISNPPAWTVFISKYGYPVRIEAADRPVSAPVVRWIEPTHLALAHVSRGLVTGTPSQPRLTASGERFAHLLSFPNR